ncbi:MAG: PAS-domain containing protein [Proteobacteria bacterium]|nr:PAS-domain containing protein [Pseudomonadota bacterium]
MAKATQATGQVDPELLCRLMSTCYEELERDRKRVDRANKLMQEELEQLTADMGLLINQLRVQNVHFQGALDNMSQGLCLLDDAGRLIVANRRFLQIYGLAPKAALPGRPIEQILRDSMTVTRLQAYLALSRATQAGNLRQDLKDGRVIQIVHEPLDGGGSVDTFADITERTRADAELAQAHKQLVEISRQAGMAEVATGVLHNVGNVLNSVNVSANLLSQCARNSKASNLARVVSVLREHQADLGNFVTAHPQGKHLTSLLENLDRQLAGERTQVLEELASLGKNIEHIKDIVSMQQSYAVVGGIQEQICVTDLVEDSLKMSLASLNRHRVEVIRDYGDASVICVDKHKALQILVNLVSNAKHACVESGRPDSALTLRTGRCGDRVRVSVSDNGVGIPAENLTRIFNHGFTTRKTGHGFGLHSAALAARELNGSLTASSDGMGRGATFILDLPAQMVQSVQEPEVAHA